MDTIDEKNAAHIAAFFPYQPVPCPFCGQPLTEDDADYKCEYCGAQMDYPPDEDDAA
jgi:Zn finger protein HypA/HybF involved in hydrogenase expression